MSHIVVHQSEYRDPWEERKPWNPLESAQYFHGYEITRHDDEANPPLDPKYRSKTGKSLYRTDFRKPAPTGPPRQRTPPAQLVENAFLATSEHADNFAWHEHYERPERPLPVPPQTETAWPNVSYHGRVPPGEKAFRDAIIEKEEERAWRTEGKVLPERMHAYHGEDEAKAVGKEPLSRAGNGYLSRQRAQPTKPGAPAYTRNGTGSSYAWPRKEVVRKPHGSAVYTSTERRAIVTTGKLMDSTNVRTRADEFNNRSDIIDAMKMPEGRPESAPVGRRVPIKAEKPAMSERRPVQPWKGLVSTAEWKKRQKEAARVAMPGAPKEAAMSGRPGERAADVRPRITAAPRPCPTGFGGEPLDLGAVHAGSIEQARGGKLFKWHTIKANRYR